MSESKSSDTEDSEEELFDIDLSSGNKDAYILDVRLFTFCDICLKLVFDSLSTYLSRFSLFLNLELVRIITWEGKKEPLYRWNLFVPFRATHVITKLGCVLWHLEVWVHS